MPEARGASRPPNVIWVFADQMRGQAMGCAGDPNVRTPHLDRLAAEGVRFTAACSTYPVCVPFRFSLLTGEHAHTRWIPALNWRLSPAERTIAHEFNDAGYETAYIGKWHLNGSVPLRDARAMNRTPVLPGYRGGFQVWHGFNLRNDYFDTCCFHGDDPRPVPLGKYQTDGLFDIAADYLRARRDRRPFFMALSVEAPHPPHQAPPDCLQRLRERTMIWRPNFRPVPARAPEQRPKWSHLEEKDVPDLPRRYYAQIENLDENVGRLMAVLRECGLDENTAVMFFSDHGEMLGSHGLYQKQFPYEEAINIPLIVRAPNLGVRRLSAALDAPVCTEDLYPTTLALAGLPCPPAKPGLDLTPYMRGEPPALPREAVYLEFVEEDREFMVFHGSAWRGIRTARFKYTVLDGRPWQLFDLQADPFEMRNLVDSPPDRPIRLELHERLRRMAAETGDSFSFVE